MVCEDDFSPTEGFVSAGAARYRWRSSPGQFKRKNTIMYPIVTSCNKPRRSSPTEIEPEFPQPEEMVHPSKVNFQSNQVEGSTPGVSIMQVLTEFQSSDWTHTHLYSNLVVLYNLMDLVCLI